MNSIKKSLSISLITIHLVVQLMLVPNVLAAPEAPTAASAPEAPTASSAPQPTSAPTAPPAPSSKTPEQLAEEKKAEEQKEAEEKAQQETEDAAKKAAKEAQKAAAAQAAANASPSPSASSTPNATATPAPTQAPNQSGNIDNSGNSGTTDVKTGDANANVVGAAIANTNTSATPSSDSGPSATITNTGNGANSTNDASATIVNNNNTNQQNSATVTNEVSAQANSGNNTASKNLGDTNIKTGDANVSGTLITSVNTNVDGVAVAEFNITDDHKGDILLDFAQGCVSGCGNGTTNLANTGNGADSTNSATLNTQNNNNTFQSNDAVIENSLVLSADSGNNDASKNTGGDTSIETGDANIAATALTFANNNISGNAFVNMINVFGNLVGDIILTEEAMKNYIASCGSACGTDLNAANSGNGAGSTNETNVNLTENNNTFQSNTADIENNIILAANTGDNKTSENTGGDSTIKTGEANVDANILNIANSNVAGDGTWWLVIVNEAGNWIGKIMGGNGSNMAGSNGTEFTVNENGEITASNNGNGTGSTNTTNINQETNNNTTQTNNAKLVNNMDLSGNTGGNTASKNTGGNSDIKTGDVNVIANMVNFVNNNIAGNGKLVVTVVNVFGSWLGDFVSPGQEKQPKPTAVAQATQTPAPVVAQGNTQQESNNEEDDETTITSTNKKKTKKTVKVEQNGIDNEVAGTSTSNTTSTLAYQGNEEPEVSETTPTIQTEVLGQKVDAKDTLTKKTLRINLAYAVLLLPLGLGVLAYVKRRNLVNALNEWSKNTRQWFF